MIEAFDLMKHYPVVSGLRALFSRNRNQVVRAVDGVSFSVKNGEVLGIVGESGCGKSTTAKLLVGLENPTNGEFKLDGDDGASLCADDRLEFYNRVQMIFQDPYGSINPSHDVFTIVSNPLVYRGAKDRAEIKRRVYETMEMVGLSPVEIYLNKHPHLLSGGQRQRLCIARAIIVNPTNLVADEPISMLDVSIKWDVIRLLKRLVDQNNLSMVYITHDLATVPTLCDHLAIMYLGKIVEIGPTAEILRQPAHPYTKALIASVPQAEFGAERAAARILGGLDTAIDLPKGCRFQDRCPDKSEVCMSVEPTLAPHDGRDVACFKLDPAANMGRSSQSELK